MASTDLLVRVPLKFLRDNFIIPLSIDGKIVIVTANPNDFQPIMI